MQLTIAALRAEMDALNTFEELQTLQGKITAQTPAESGLNFAEACDLLKEIGDKMRDVKWGQR
jgi:hypothetical protein